MLRICHVVQSDYRNAITFSDVSVNSAEHIS